MQKYIVFKCSKCFGYTYAKISQKGKKCPRCGRNHTVEKQKGDIVEGPTEAMIRVKRFQNMKTGNKLPELKSSVRDVVIAKAKGNGNFNENKTEFGNFVSVIYKFQLNEKIDPNSGFPAYILDILLNEIGFPKFKQKKMIERLKRSSKLVEVNSDYYYMFK
jgi:PHP family Zn ribbon phosphoesterase